MRMNGSGMKEAPFDSDGNHLFFAVCWSPTLTQHVWKDTSMDNYNIVFLSNYLKVEPVRTRKLPERKGEITEVIANKVLNLFSSWFNCAEPHIATRHLYTPSFLMNPLLNRKVGVYECRVAQATLNDRE